MSNTLARRVAEGALRPQAGTAIVKAIETVIAETKLRTPDLGGKTKTNEMGKAIADAL